VDRGKGIPKEREVDRRFVRAPPCLVVLHLCSVIFFISCDIEESLGMRLLASIYALKVDL
jgi:hypothetical protein